MQLMLNFETLDKFFNPFHAVIDVVKFNIDILRFYCYVMRYMPMSDHYHSSQLFTIFNVWNGSIKFSLQGAN